jgi:hypothetical protein
LRARSAGQRQVLTVTRGQPSTPVHLRTDRLTRCASRLLSSGSRPGNERRVSARFQGAPGGHRLAGFSSWQSRPRLEALLTRARASAGSRRTLQMSGAKATRHGGFVLYFLRTLMAAPIAEASSASSSGPFHRTYHADNLRRRDCRKCSAAAEVRSPFVTRIIGPTEPA